MHAALPRAPLRGRGRLCRRPATTTWMAECQGRSAERVVRRSFKRTVPAASVDAFDALPLVSDGSKPRVGVVGEILVKFHPTANNQVVRRHRAARVARPYVPGLVEFFLFGMTDAVIHEGRAGHARPPARFTAQGGLSSSSRGFREPVNKTLEASTRFEPYRPASGSLPRRPSQVLSLCNTMGEGWLLTAEMVRPHRDRHAQHRVLLSRLRACPTTWWARPSSSALREPLPREQHRGC